MVRFSSFLWLNFICAYIYQYQFSGPVMSNSLWPHELQHVRPPCPSPTPGAYPNLCPMNWWCHLTISSSVVSFSSYLQSFPTSGSFQMSQFFTSGGQNVGDSASASVLPINIQDCFSLGFTSLISLQSKGLVWSPCSPNLKWVPKSTQFYLHTVNSAPDCWVEVNFLLLKSNIFERQKLKLQLIPGAWVVDWEYLKEEVF